MIFHLNEEYSGEWKMDKRHGLGKYDWADGSSYEGWWEDDCMHGLGIYID